MLIGSSTGLLQIVIIVCHQCFLSAFRRDMHKSKMEPWPPRLQPVPAALEGTIMEDCLKNMVDRDCSGNRQDLRTTVTLLQMAAD